MDDRTAANEHLRVQTSKLSNWQRSWSCSLLANTVREQASYHECSGERPSDETSTLQQGNLLLSHPLLLVADAIGDPVRWQGPEIRLAISPSEQSDDIAAVWCWAAHRPSSIFEKSNCTRRLRRRLRFQRGVTGTAARLSSPQHATSMSITRASTCGSVTRCAVCISCHCPCFD